MEAVEALAIVSGHVEEELLIRNEYLAAENQILKSKLEKPVRFNDNERIKLSKIGKRLGLKALKEISCIVKPETIMEWFRKLVAKKFDGSPYRKSHGRPSINHELERLIIQFAKENPGWGYDRIVGALSNLGHKVSDQTVGNVLKRNGIPPVPERSKDTTWATFIKRHQHIIAACDFFTTEVITPNGLITYYVLFFIHLSSRKVHIAGITPYPNEEWMKQMARNVTMAEYGFLSNCNYLIHDRDSKFCKSFSSIIKSGDVKPLKLPPRSPNLNAICERWVLSVKSEVISGLIFFSEESLQRTLKEYITHYHQERNHQGKDNRLLFPIVGYNPTKKHGTIKCRIRLGGILKYYLREAA
ncbi:MAG: transposase [Deltaproteobacteria bacterium]|jgi:putative transposase|nr:transposase [Deltaproteobacteria bacterium]MBT4526378.1 transposase [Deltaproteobacteria bacterium]